MKVGNLGQSIIRTLTVPNAPSKATYATLAWLMDAIGAFIEEIKGGGIALMNIGKAIKMCRVQRNLTQAELAKKVGLSDSYISLMEQGKRDPSMSTIESIADALHVPLFILVFLASDKVESELGEELTEKLSKMALTLIQRSNTRDEQTRSN